MANVQAGDRAVVVRDSGCGKNIGKIVFVSEQSIPYRNRFGRWRCVFDDVVYEHPGPGALCWGVESLGSEFVFNNGESGMTGVIEDSYLKKLPDLKDEDEALPRDVAKPSARAVESSRW